MRSIKCESISRGKGQNVIERAAFFSGSCLKDDDSVYDYSSKRVEFSKIIYPPFISPAKRLGRNELWNYINKSFTRKNAGLAFYLILMIPSNLPLDKRKVIAEKFALYLSVRYKVPIDLNMSTPVDNKNTIISSLFPRCSMFEDGSLGKIITYWSNIGSGRAELKHLEEIRQHLIGDV